MATVQIAGTVAPGFEPVRAAFEENFRERGEVGAACCIYVGDRRVVDLWGGLADPQADRPWEADTLVPVFSATKGMAALTLLLLAEQGVVKYDARIATFWPEFAQAGKAETTVRHLLNHRWGVVGLDTPLRLQQFADLEAVGAALARQEPMWAPGAQQGYGAVTLGEGAAQVCWRLTGETVGTRFAREVADPLEADVYIGLPPGHHHRVARLEGVSTWTRLTKMVPRLITGRTVEGRVARAFLKPGSATGKALRTVDMGPDGAEAFNRPEVQRLELCWGGGVASARGLSRVYAALANGGALDGVRLCQPASLEPVHRRQSWAVRDEVLQKPLGFSLGFLKEETRLFSPNPASFGHAGMGGALGWADPVAGVGFGYVLNRLDHHIRSPRAVALCHALYRCL